MAYDFIVTTKIEKKYIKNSVTQKFMSRHNEELKVEKLYHDTKILCCDTIKSRKKGTLSRQSFFMSRHTI